MAARLVAKTDLIKKTELVAGLKKIVTELLQIKVNICL